MKAKRVQEIYDEIGGYIIELDPDPVTRGPAYLQDLIAKCRGYQNAVSLILHEVHREKHALESKLWSLKASFQVSSDELLSGDRRVKNLPSIDDRKASINTILCKERDQIDEAENELRDLGFVDKAVRHRSKELSDTMSAIRLQRSLIRDELDTGSFYGDESRESRNQQLLKEGSLDGFGQEEDFRDLLEDAFGEDESEEDSEKSEDESEGDLEEVVEEDASEEEPEEDLEEEGEPVEEEPLKHSEDEEEDFGDLFEDDSEVVRFSESKSESSDSEFEGLFEDEEESGSGDGEASEKSVLSEPEVSDANESEETPQDVGGEDPEDTDIDEFLKEGGYEDLFEGLEDEDTV
jgi:hypothetical protein